MATVKPGLQRRPGDHGHQIDHNHSGGGQGRPLQQLNQRPWHQHCAGTQQRDSIHQSRQNGPCKGVGNPQQQQSYGNDAVGDSYQLPLGSQPLTQRILQMAQSGQYPFPPCFRNSRLDPPSQSRQSGTDKIPGEHPGAQTHGAAGKHPQNPGQNSRHFPHRLIGKGSTILKKAVNRRCQHRPRRFRCLGRERGQIGLQHIRRLLCHLREPVGKGSGLPHQQRPQKQHDPQQQHQCQGNSHPGGSAPTQPQTFRPQLYHRFRCQSQSGAQQKGEQEGQQKFPGQPYENEKNQCEKHPANTHGGHLSFMQRLAFSKICVTMRSVRDETQTESGGASWRITPNTTLWRHPRCRRFF